MACYDLAQEVRDDGWQWKTHPRKHRYAHDEKGPKIKSTCTKLWAVHVRPVTNVHTLIFSLPPSSAASHALDHNQGNCLSMNEIMHPRTGRQSPTKLAIRGWRASWCGSSCHRAVTVYPTPQVQIAESCQSQPNAVPQRLPHLSRNLLLS